LHYTVVVTDSTIAKKEERKNVAVAEEEEEHGIKAYSGKLFSKCVSYVFWETLFKTYFM